MFIALTTDGWTSRATESYNTVTQRGLQVNQLDRLLGRLRRVVSFFHRSTTAVLKTKQKLLELPSNKLINDVPTRWNSTYDMIKRFLEQQPAIEATLLTKDIKKMFKDIVTLSEDDVSTAEKIMEVLKPIKIATVSLCDAKTPTISMIHPTQQKLLQGLSILPDDNKLVTDVKAAISKDLSPRYSDPETVQLLLESSFLDPRFKSMPYLNDAQRAELFSNISYKAVLLNETLTKTIKVEKLDPIVPEQGGSHRDQHPTGPTLQMDCDDDMGILAETASPKESDSPPNKRQATKHEKESALESLFGDVFVTKVVEAPSMTDRIATEIKNYNSEPSESLNANPLQWWKVHEMNYPLLSTLSKKYMCVPATSVASEMIFSSAGDLVTAQRSCLSPDHVDHLIFLYKNLKI